MTAQIINGDCLEAMAAMDAESIHAIVTDPPYGLGFMGKKWDYGVPGVAFWIEALRVAKPGAYLLAFGGTRTFHRIVCAIEDAGWEIRDRILWLYGSGFPKSKNLADEWEGWGSALKPAHEPIIVARKPFKGPLQANMEVGNAGAMNINGCRVQPDGGHREREGEASADRRYADKGATDFAPLPGPRGGDPSGRWPANVVHDGSDEVLAAFPNAPGQQATVTGNEPSGVMGHANCYGRMDSRHAAVPRIDTGSAARFFYCAKAPRSERNAGVEDLPERPLLWSSGSASPGTFQAPSTKRAAQNNHPTVKPIDLMRWLCRLVTLPGGAVLDPFCGSGSTGCAAVAEGFDFIGIELDADYADIARRRIAVIQPGLTLGDA